MNELTLNAAMTMSSREIAELTGKEHKNVLRDIRLLEQQLHGSNLSYVIKVDRYKAENNQWYDYCALDKDTTLTLLLGYDAVARMKVVKRWQELEAQQQPKLPTTYIEALENLLATEKERARLESVNNALMHVSKLYNTTEIAKELGFRSGSKLNLALRDKGIQFKTGGTWVLYAGYAEMGLVSIKQNISPSGYTYYDRRWTQKGREFILALFGRIKNTNASTV